MRMPHLFGTLDNEGTNGLDEDEPLHQVWEGARELRMQQMIGRYAHWMPNKSIDFIQVLFASTGQPIHVDLLQVTAAISWSPCSN